MPTWPPVLAILLPDVKYKGSPAPLVPLPADTLTPPLHPAVDVPVAMVMIPLLPALVELELKIK